MAIAKSYHGAVIAAASAFLVGTAGGYGINEMVGSSQTTDLEREIARLKEEAQRKTHVDAPVTRRQALRLRSPGGRCESRGASRAKPCRV